jgi:hypothetical protein
MNNEYDNAIPPIVKDYINKLLDKETPMHIKANYAEMLGRISDACQGAIRKYATIKPVQKKKRV